MGKLLMAGSWYSLEDPTWNQRWPRHFIKIHKLVFGAWMLMSHLSALYNSTLYLYHFLTSFHCLLLPKPPMFLLMFHGKNTSVCAHYNCFSGRRHDVILTTAIFTLIIVSSSVPRLCHGLLLLPLAFSSPSLHPSHFRTLKAPLGSEWPRKLIWW